MRVDTGDSWGEKKWVGGASRSRGRAIAEGRGGKENGAEKNDVRAILKSYRKRV